MKGREVTQGKDLWQLASLWDTLKAALWQVFMAAASFGLYPHAYYHCFPKGSRDGITGDEKR